MDRQQKKLEEEIAAMESSLTGNQDSEAQAEEPEETSAVTEEQSAPATTEPSDEETTDHDQKEPKKRISWKKRFVNLKASQDATIRELRLENANLKEKNIDLSAQVDKLAAQLRILSERSEPEIISDEEKDLLGEDAVKVVKKITQANLEKHVKPLQDSLEKQRQEALEAQRREAQAQRQQAVQTFLEKLGGLVPDYAEIDSNPDFLAYMEEIDTVSGLPRKVIFKKAESFGDVGRVASFFNDFKATQNSVESRLEEQVAPSNHNSALAANQPNQSPPITRADVDKFYDDCIKGRYDGREKERLAYEKRIEEAFMQGLL